MYIKVKLGGKRKRKNITNEKAKNVFFINFDTSMININNTQGCKYGILSNAGILFLWIKAVLLIHKNSFSKKKICT